MIASRPAASLPHTGIATFCKAPYVFDPAEIDADIAILGRVYGLLALQSKGRPITRNRLQLSGFLSPFNTRRSGL
jgi:hypothetical protein